MAENYLKLFGVNRKDTSIEDDGCRLRNIELLGYVRIIENSLRMPPNLRYYREPEDYPLHVRPSNRASDFAKMRKAETRLEIYQTALLRQYGLRTANYLKELDFILHSTTMKRIMMTPYRLKYDWNVLATHYKGRIYMNMVQEDHEVRLPTPIEDRAMRYCFTDMQEEKWLSNPSLDTMDVCTPLYGMFRGSLRHFNIQWNGAEVSGLLNSTPLTDLDIKGTLDLAEHVLFRCMRYDPNWRDEEILLDWSLDALLSNSSRVYFAFYNSSTLVRQKVLKLDLNDLISKQRWKLHCCTGFLYKVLDYIDDVMVPHYNSPPMTWQFRYFSDENTVRYLKQPSKSQSSSNNLFHIVDHIFK